MKLTKLMMAGTLLFALSCYGPRMQQCFLRYYPLVYITGFDTTQLDSIRVNKYMAISGHDSLVSSKAISVSDTLVFISADTFFITPYLQSDPRDFYYSANTEQYEIIFANNKIVRLSNFTYEDKQCLRGESEFRDPCYCGFIHCEADTTNCNCYIKGKQIFITP